MISVCITHLSFALLLASFSKAVFRPARTEQLVERRERERVNYEEGNVNAGVGFKNSGYKTEETQVLRCKAFSCSCWKHALYLQLVLFNTLLHTYMYIREAPVYFDVATVVTLCLPMPPRDSVNLHLIYYDLTTVNINTDW